jgi:branched-chain amino acid transport system permease protein
MGHALLLAMQGILQNLVFGLFVGSVYGIGAVGLALTFGVLKILNVAHGELVMLGAYASFWLFLGAGLDPFVALLIVIPLMFAVGVLLHMGLFERLTRMEPETKIKNSLLVSFGLGLIIQNGAILVWTGDERSIQTPYAGAGLELAGIALPFTRMATFVIALVCILALWFFLQRTRTGRAVRATAEDWEAATQAGIHINRTYLLTFSLGAAAAGVAGALIGVTYGFTPTIGLAWTLKALIIVVLAGTGSILGAFPAGLLLGLAEAVSGMVIGAEYREVVGLVLFLIVLLVRPQGLFGKTRA